MSKGTGSKSKSKSISKSKSPNKSLDKPSKSSIKSIGEDMGLQIIEVALRIPEEIENKTIGEYIRLKENIGRVDKGIIEERGANI